MRNSELRYVLLWAALLLSSVGAWGQMFPERRHIREGNRHYGKQEMAEAQNSYRQALRLDSLSVAGAFNLGDAQYASGDFAAAEESFRGLLERNPRLTDDERASGYYNLGAAQFQQQKFGEAAESFKSSLRLRPENLEAKFNYVLSKALAEEQENNQNQQQQNPQNQDQNSDNQQNQNPQNQQQESESTDQNDKSDPNEEQQQPQPNDQSDEPEAPKPEATEEQADPSVGPSPESEQLLDAVQAAEDKTREKVDGEKAVVVGRSGKNW
ncbi:MAG: tetratricopeptide repeat protein [Tidjanibacter sp.]|nr:tetratricopeptide repeat protein [Tidjanibacter sp.]